jgi:hypothetical protein
MRPEQHLAIAREAIEEQHRVVVGKGVINYSAERRAWVLPGGLTTTHRPAAERAAKMIDRMMSGGISGPRVAKAGG